MTRFLTLISISASILLTWLLLSCNNSSKPYNSEVNSIKAEATIDSSFWLKETRGIRDILEDKAGNLWFSSPDYIAKFDGEALHYFSEKDGLSITGHLHEDAHQAIWVENGFQAFKYNGDSFLEESIEGINGTNGLWFQRGLDLTDTTYVVPGIYETNQKGTVFHPLPIKQDINNKFKHLGTTKALLGKDGTIWFGTMEHVYGLKDEDFTVLGRNDMGRQDDDRHMGIRGIFVDSQGVLWMADNGAGVFTYTDGQVVNFTKKHQLDTGDVEGPTLHRAFSIAEDSEGHMWFGTVYSGIWMYNPETNQFINYSKDAGVMSDTIWTIYKTQQGELLFAGETPAAVYAFNGKTFVRRF